MKICVEKMKSMQKCFLLSAVILCALFFWIMWSSRALDSISEETLQQNLHRENDITIQLNSEGKFIKATNFSPKATELPLIELPKHFNSINLEGWEIFAEEGDENIPGNEADYMQGERTAPTLTFKNREFLLNHKHFRIFSGALHYFRVVPEYWMDRLKKLKACGLNTVETYLAWNLHEPSPGQFDFEGILNFRKFILTAAELGLYVIIRPGPYICSEFEYGGLPGWLLSDPTLKARTNHRGYIERVNIFYSQVLPRVLDLQFGEGGPIIMFQVENEYLSYGADPNHVKLLYYMMRKYGVKEMIVTSDHTFGLAKEDSNFDMSKYALPTINGGKYHFEKIGYVENTNSDFPILVMEFWCGWFDFWKDRAHQTAELAVVEKFLSQLIDKKYSFNFYMFLGGTNFGFTNGANIVSNVYRPITTSYDYDAPLTEAGDTTPKYFVIRDKLLEFYKSIGIPYLPEVPPNLHKANNGTLRIAEILEWTHLLAIVPMKFQEQKLDYMENYRDESGRHHTLGYIVYSHLLRAGTSWHRLQGQHFTGYVSGRLTAILSGETFYVGTDSTPVQEDEFLWDKKMNAVAEGTEPQDKTKILQLDLMVENQGRVNFYTKGSHNIDHQRIGLKGQVLKEVFGIQDEEWSVKFLHFDKHQCQSFSESKAWMTLRAYKRFLEDMEQTQRKSPALYRTYLDIGGTPADTFVKLKGWTKGIVIVNGFNLGRYWNVGPQKTLYLPAPLLKQGKNEIMVFEEMSGGEDITFQNEPILG